MVNVYVGVKDVAEGTMAFEFETPKEASKFMDDVATHYKESKEKLFLYMERVD